jgi:2-oxo-4-hydroxy-4-carboxy-5-ureidoimidazoline decarboxylase
VAIVANDSPVVVCGLTIEQLNAADRAAFVAAVGFTFEHSPWIAEEAWQRRPFRDAEALLEAMHAVLAAAPKERRIALIAAHPDLGGRLAREGRLSAASAREQSAAGFDRLTPEEIARFDELNSAYRARFEFPFVICARERSKASLLAALEQRLANDRESEIEAALVEIVKIARFRLRDAFAR